MNNLNWSHPSQHRLGLKIPTDADSAKKKKNMTFHNFELFFDTLVGEKWAYQASVVRSSSLLKANSHYKHNTTESGRNKVDIADVKNLWRTILSFIDNLKTAFTLIQQAPSVRGLSKKQNPGQKMSTVHSLQLKKLGVNTKTTEGVLGELINAFFCFVGWTVRGYCGERLCKIRIIQSEGRLQGTITEAGYSLNHPEPRGFVQKDPN